MRCSNGIFVGVHKETEKYTARLYQKQNGSVDVHEFTAHTLDEVLRKLVNSPHYVRIADSPCYLRRGEFRSAGGLLHDRGYEALSFEEFERALELYRKHGNRLMSTGPDIDVNLGKVLRWQDKALNDCVVNHKDNKSSRKQAKK